MVFQKSFTSDLVWPAALDTQHELTNCEKVVPGHKLLLGHQAFTSSRPQHSCGAVTGSLAHLLHFPDKSQTVLKVFLSGTHFPEAGSTPPGWTLLSGIKCNPGSASDTVSAGKHTTSLTTWNDQQDVIEYIYLHFPICPSFICNLSNAAPIFLWNLNENVIELLLLFNPLTNQWSLLLEGD